MARKKTDVRVEKVRLYFLPVQTRMPLKFGPETLTSVTCARVKMQVRHASLQAAVGWGETPLSVQWVWPSSLSYEERHAAMKDFCVRLAKAWATFNVAGHAMEVGLTFLQDRLPELLAEFNAQRAAGTAAHAAGTAPRKAAAPKKAAGPRKAVASAVPREPMPYLAALVCCSAFDIALHDAYGQLHGQGVYRTYNAGYLGKDLAAWLKPERGSAVRFRGKYPCDFLVRQPRRKLPAWHLVGGKDPVDESELTGGEPDDGYPVLLADWIRRDALTCLKVKLRGNDPAWDYDRLVKVGQTGVAGGVEWLTTDFNCTVTDPAYVTGILDRLMAEHPRLYGMILYVEQPFPYDLEANQIDVHGVSARKPLFMDESAHDWRLVRLGRELGWTGVALKTCKTQSGALLALCWAKAHGMTLMVQDLTNPMLAQIPHVLLAAHAGTIMGVETNAMQFYPEASRPEAVVHPGLYTRREGTVDLATIQGSGFGYRLEEIPRELPPHVAEF